MYFWAIHCYLHWAETPAPLPTPLPPPPSAFISERAFKMITNFWNLLRRNLLLCGKFQTETVQIWGLVFRNAKMRIEKTLEWESGFKNVKMRIGVGVWRLTNIFILLGNRTFSWINLFEKSSVIKSRLGKYYTIRFAAKYFIFSHNARIFYVLNNNNKFMW